MDPRTEQQHRAILHRAFRADRPESIGAMEALRQLDRRWALERLTAALGHRGWRVRQRAAHALGYLGDSEAFDTLAATLRAPDPTMHAAAAYALQQLGDPRAIPLLVASLDTDHAACNVIHALIAFDKPALLSLFATLEWGNSRSRLNAIHAVRQFWHEGRHRDSISERAVPLLIAALTDEDGRVRGYAAVVLGVIGDARAIDSLLTLLRDPDTYVRWSLIHALGQLGDARALPALEWLHQHDRGTLPIHGWERPGRNSEAAEQAIARIRG
jgi:HEAT repeat protein